jgi:hypothetical protein
MADWTNLLESLCGLGGLRCPADHRQPEGRRTWLASYRPGAKPAVTRLHTQSLVSIASSCTMYVATCCSYVAPYR